MKLLTLMRHAEAGVADGGRDFDRPLTSQGLQDASRMARRLRAAGLDCDRLLVSTATRARQTARAVAQELRIDGSATEHIDDLYLASTRSLVDLARDLEADVSHGMIIGHNPGLADLADLLSPGAIAGLPTCGVVRLELDVEAWATMAPGCGMLLDFDSPKRDRHD